MNLLLSALLAFISLTSSLLGDLRLNIGPEFYKLERERAGGAFQDGHMIGLDITFERLKPYCFYLGGEYLYAKGDLKGETPKGNTLTSDVTDELYELRFGFTFCSASPRFSFFTPFTGWGHFKEINSFCPPSPLTYTFTDTFDYVTVGFLSGTHFNPLLSIGLNFKLRFMLEGRSRVSDDPLYNTVTLMMQDEIQVRVETPVELVICPSFFKSTLLVSPFYEFRHFGGREGYPFDFKETTFNLYGTRLALSLHF